MIFFFNIIQLTVYRMVRNGTQFHYITFPGRINKYQQTRN